MLDLRFVRENPEIVKQNVRNKFQDSKLPLVDELIALYTEKKKSVSIEELSKLIALYERRAPQINDAMTKINQES